MKSLLLIHEYYGDPRSRGIYPFNFEIFPLYRLSVISHMYNKLKDYEILS